ncbi:hypothetical protein F4808DRAFT_401018 [Astrocystis sublimbata]|nr:hypothetical protein F4808DRAFT_401018 [Astrocystis sublimbata]
MRQTLLHASLALLVALSDCLSVQSTSQCSEYTVRSGDDCVAISKKFNISWAQLLSWNPTIDKTCSNSLGGFTGKKICVSNPLGNFALPMNSVVPTSVATTAAPLATPVPDGTNHYCGEYYLVASGEDCSTITTKYGITMDDFLFLNPEVWRNCTNLFRDYNYCVKPVGTISTYSGYPGATTTLPFHETKATSKPYEDLLQKFSTNMSIIPLANGTRVDCYSSTSCWSLADFFDVTKEELVLWNPSFENKGKSGSSLDQYLYDCKVSESVSYCVQLASPTPEPKKAIETPSPRAAGEIKNCITWYSPYSYTTCEDILSMFYLTIGEFYKLNPSVGKECTHLAIGTYYCVLTTDMLDDDEDDTNTGKPGTTTTKGATTKTTTKGATTKTTTKGTTTKTTTKGATTKTTTKGATTKTTTKATTTKKITTTSKATGVSTPSPVQTGIASNCNKFYKVKSGDGCWAIADKLGIALADFYSWNPAVKKDCSDLEINVYVCISVSSKTSTRTTTTKKPSPTKTKIVTPTPTQSGMVSGCTSFHKVLQGNSCPDIAKKYSITLANFYAWNPAVGNKCLNLWLNNYVCVGKK